MLFLHRVIYFSLLDVNFQFYSLSVLLVIKMLFINSVRTVFTHALVFGWCFFVKLLYFPLFRVCCLPTFSMQEKWKKEFKKLGVGVQLLVF